MKTPTLSSLAHRWARLSLGLVTIGAALAPATVASADPLVSFAELPEGSQEPFVVADRPASLPASAKVDGFVVRHPDYGHYARSKHAPELPQYAMIFGSDAEADAHLKGTDQRNTPPSGSCFESSGFARDGDRVEWTGSLMTIATVSADVDHFPDGMSAVQPIRSERIKTTGDGRAVLEVVHAWVDAKTTGAKLISKHEVPLKLIPTSGDVVRMYAYRSHDEVHFLLTQSELEPAHNFVEALTVSNGDGMVSSSQAPCHVRAALKVAKGRADTATVRLEAILPPEASEDTEGRNDGLIEFRARPMAIGISSSWLRADEAPVLSITRGWAGRERTQLM